MSKPKVSLAEKYPEVATQWHPTKNGNLSPSEVTYGSKKVAWWIGDCGHDWDAPINARSLQGQQCPYCAGKRVLVGFNDLATVHPDVAAQWHPTKNGTLTPQDVVARSNYRVYWLCDKGHESYLVVSEMTRENRRGCAYCTGRKIKKNDNDLLTLYPELAADCVNEADKHLSPGSSKKVEWKCSQQGHRTWMAPVRARVKGSGCPSCSGKIVIVGVTDLATKAPHLLLEWDDPHCAPHEVSYGSHYKAVWKCKEGHRWKTSVYHRVGPGNGCPMCAGSKGERELYEYIVALLGDRGLVSHHDRAALQGKELDIYVPSKKIAVEYNGLYWHSEAKIANKNYHYEKWKSCEKQGIQLIQVWEDEWLNSRTVVEKMIASKLGVLDSEKVSARKTKVVELDYTSTVNFLQENHIQGTTSGSHSLGLQDKDSEEIVAALVTKWVNRENRVLSIERYATSKNVRGGFTKLLSYCEKNYEPSELITFSDNCVSTGALYETNGFFVDAYLPPDYRYVVDNERKHKFGYRLDKFRSDPNLYYQEGMTERELALANGLSRIWDAGKIRWKKEV